MSCGRDVAGKVESQTVGSEELDVNIKRLKDLTDKIKAVTDCDALKMELGITGDELKELTKDVSAEAKKLLEKYLPILKIPTNPLKIIPWVKKLVSGSITPQLEAYIKYTMQLIQLAQAVAEFASVAGEVLPKLKECAISTIQDEIGGAIGLVKGEIQKEVAKIKKEIKDAICDAGSKSGLLDAIDLVIDAVDATNDLIDSINDIKDAVDNAVNTGLGAIKDAGTQLDSLIGTSFTVDTSSPQAFVQSVNNGDVQKYNDQVNEAINLPPPVNTSPPVVTGTAFVGETLTATVGEWSANGVSNNAAFNYSYQWYSNGVPIGDATSSTYVISTNDLDKTITCGVTAENATNAEQANSAPTALVDIDESAGALPAISGSARVGFTLTCSEGTYPYVPKYVSYTWYRVVGASYVQVKAEASAETGGNQYVVQSGDLGYPIVCRVLAQRFFLVAKKTSNPTSTVTY